MMDALGIAGLVVGILGTALALAIALRGRQLSRPKLRVDVGYGDVRGQLPRSARRLPASTLVFVTSTPERPQLVAIPFFVHNSSNVPVTDLSLRIEYPATCLLADGLDVETPTANYLVRVESSSEVSRTAITVLGKAFVSFDLGVLRPHETVVATEIILLRPLVSAEREAGLKDGTAARVVRRFADIQSVEAFIILDFVARSSNGPVVAMSQNIISCVCDTADGLLALGHQFVQAAWEDKRPAPGVYFDPLRPVRPSRWFRPSRKERFSFLFLNPINGGDNENSQQIAERSLGATLAIGRFEVPPWGLAGEAFDINVKMGTQLF